MSCAWACPDKEPRGEQATACSSIPDSSLVCVWPWRRIGLPPSLLRLGLGEQRLVYGLWPGLMCVRERKGGGLGYPLRWPRSCPCLSSFGHLWLQFLTAEHTPEAAATASCYSRSHLRLSKRSSEGMRTLCLQRATVRARFPARGVQTHPGASTRTTRTCTLARTNVYRLALYAHTLT